MQSSPYPCPCCGELTVNDPGGFEICPICAWEDDGQGDEDADVIRGGPNGNLSLTDARRRFATSSKFARDIAELVRASKEKREK